MFPWQWERFRVQGVSLQSPLLCPATFGIHCVIIFARASWCRIVCEMGGWRTFMNEDFIDHSI